MKRISKILNNNDYEEGSIGYPEDVRLIRKFVPEIAHLSLREIADIWEEFNNTRRARWLDPHESKGSYSGTLDDFREWLFEDVFND